MKTGKKRLTGTLLALCAALLVLCIVLAIGWSKAAKADAVLPEVRNNGTAVQWKYRDETDWRDLVALTELTGAAGENGRDGANGKNGTDGKNGINGANGKDGMNGVYGTDGQNGIDGKDGSNGADGKNGINGANGKDGMNGVDGTDGQNGIDGKDGVNGKDGVDAKNIEVQRTESYIQWRYEGGEWQNLVAIADITGPAGQNGADGSDGKTPEFRVNENTLQWRYTGDEIWLNLYDLSVLKGLDGKDGTDGATGKDGKTPFIGENGNWWIGETDTGVKAAGVDGEKGDKGDPGEKGDKGDKGDKGQNGSCAGWFYGTLWTKGDLYKEDGAERPVGIKVYKEAESGGFVSTYMDEIYLKKGHTYSVTISASMELQSHEDRSGNYSVQMTDNYDDGFCREATRIKRDGVKLPYSRDQHHFSFSRIYIASDEDIPLRFKIEQSSYKTTLLGFNGTITITALD